MSSLQSDEIFINFALIKLLRCYHLFDSNGRKIFNVNVYRLTCFLITLTVFCLIIYGTIGLFTDTKDSVDSIVKMQLCFFYLSQLSCLLKVTTFLSRSDDICDLFEITRITFLTSAQCCKHFEVLYRYHKLSTRITNLCCIFGLVGLIAWALFPIVLNTWYLDNTESNRRAENILNLVYPVTIYEYNNYYFIFYAIELALSTFFVYIFVVFDVLFVYFCLAIISQLELHAYAYENIGYGRHLRVHNGNVDDFVDSCYDDFKSILFDQQKLNKKLNSFYSVIRLVILSSVVVNSGSIIILTYLFVVVLVSAESLSIISIIKFSSPYLYLLLDLYVLCYLLENINIKRESVLFGLYSCNWTEMDLKFKKLLLMTMRMNNANKLMIKATPLKVINLHLFFCVMKLSYNIVSVLLRSRTTNTN